MTVRKNFVPAGASMAPEHDEWFESGAVAELGRLPTCAWNDLLALWLKLGSAHPSTRKRIISRAFRLCHERREAPPAKLLTALDRILAVHNPRTALRRRDLCAGLRSCAEQGIPPTDDLLQALDLELVIRKEPRARANPEKVRSAAHLFARCLSIGEIAKALRCSKDTVHRFTKRAEFIKECDDELARLQSRIARLGRVLSDFAQAREPVRRKRTW